MTTTDIASKEIWYHVSSGSGDTAARWAQGAARKGVYDGKATLSVVLFDAEQIAEAIGEDPLIGADLILRRDTVYGDGSVMVCVAPVNLSSVPERYMKRSECVSLADRPLHRCSMISGTEAVIGIPGAQLLKLKSGEANGFLLYREEDGTDSYCRLSTTAVLRLYTGDDWKAPVWLRTVSAGDVVSSVCRSHIAELRELEFYINRRRVFDGLAPMAEIHDSEVGPLSEWPAVIRKLQAGVDGIVDHEAREPHTWTEPADGLPQAKVIEEIKTILSGGEEDGVPSARCYTAMQRLYKASASFKPGEKMRWTADEVKAGREKSQTTHVEQGQTITVTTYNTHVGCWMFNLNESLTINSAAVRIKVKSASGADKVHVVLRGVTVESLETDVYHQYSYEDVFDDTIFGEADCQVGEEARIPIKAAGLTKLNAHSVYGVGVRYDCEEYTEFSAEAFLLINATETTEESEGA